VSYTAAGWPTRRLSRGPRPLEVIGLAHRPGRSPLSRCRPSATVAPSGSFRPSQRNWSGAAIRSPWSTVHSGSCNLGWL